MNRPPEVRNPDLKKPRRKRLRAYASHSSERAARKLVKIRCHNCGQKVLVEADLAHRVTTCPNCQQAVHPPQRGRLWAEIGGGVVIFLLGIALGQSFSRQAEVPGRGPVSVLHHKGSVSMSLKDPPKLPEVIASRQTDDAP